MFEFFWWVSFSFRHFHSFLQDYTLKWIVFKVGWRQVGPGWSPSWVCWAGLIFPKFNGLDWALYKDRPGQAEKSRPVQTCIIDSMNAINTPFALNFRNPLVSAPENVRKYLYRQNSFQTHILDGVPGDFCTVMLLGLLLRIFCGIWVGLLTQDQDGLVSCTMKSTPFHHLLLLECFYLLNAMP